MAINPYVGIEGKYFGKYVYSDGKLKFEPLGNALDLIKIQQYEEEECYELVFEYDYNDNLHTQSIPRNVLSKKGLLEYSGKGIDAFEHTVGTLIKVIQQQEENYFAEGGTIEYLHKKLGWDKVSVDGVEVDVFKHYYVDDIYQSTYIGSYDIKPKGSLKGWIKDIKNEVIGYTPCEFILACALSSVVLGYIGVEANCENIFYHLVGDSGSGKTTMGYLATATAGNPNISANSLYRTWASTSNALISSKMGNYGLVTVLDEISMFTGRDITDLIYKISAGIDKGRLSKDCELRETKSFLTVHLSTGEASALARCRNNTGIKIRLNEVNAPWTMSAEHSERIKQNALKNYGFAAPRLAKLVKEKGREQLLVRLEFWKNRYKQETKVLEFADRMSIRHGIIMLAGELANEVFGFGLNLDNILNFIIENEFKNSNNRDIGVEAYHKLVSYIHMNQHHFAKSVDAPLKKVTEEYSTYQPLWGKIDRMDKNMKVNNKPIVEEISIFRDKFTEIIHELGFEDEKIVLEKLKAKGLLNCESGRYYRKRKIIEGGQVERVYVINVIGEDEDIEEANKLNSNTQAKRSGSQGIKKHNLRRKQDEE